MFLHTARVVQNTATDQGCNQCVQEDRRRDISDTDVGGEPNEEVTAWSSGDVELQNTEY